MIESNKHYSASLDCCRWIAAFLVLISHVRHMLFAEFDVVAHKSLLLKAFYFVTGLGDEAVVVFFVLSGLLVGGGAARKFLAGRYDARDYAIHRFSRIYVVLMPALLAGGLLDLIGLLYFNDSQLYTNHKQYVTTPIIGTIVDNLTATALVGNALMVQNWLVPVLGSNNPLWSLASEWWFYCLFWALLGAASPRASSWSRAAYGAFGIVLAAVLPAHVLLWFAIWLIGVAMAFSDRVRLRIPPLAGLAAFAAIMIGVRLLKSGNAFPNADPTLRHFVLDLVIAAGYCFLLLSLSRVQSFRLGSHRLHQTMAGFSYTTYLVHFPMMVFMAAFFHACFGIRFIQQPGLLSALYLLATTVVLYLYSYAFARLTEAKTPQVRQFLWQWSSPQLQTP